MRKYAPINIPLQIKEMYLLNYGIEEISKSLDITRAYVQFEINKIISKNKVKPQQIIEEDLYTHHEDAINAICGLTPYKKEEILSRSRKRELVIVRHYIVWVLMNSYGLGCLAVGRKLGLDHSTAIHASKNVERDLSTGYYPTVDLHNRFCEHLISNQNIYEFHEFVKKVV